jgi:aryl carrier-like protein
MVVEKFPATELSALREDLLQSGLDSRQVAELIRGFLTERGYGVSFDDARTAAASAEVLFGSLQRMQETLEKVAFFM